jgi:hypothetical protein
MRKWGVVITAFYALILLAFVVPAWISITDPKKLNWGDALAVYRQGWVWIPIGILLASQALLLFLSVDTSFRRLRPRAHILLSGLVTGLLSALLTGAVLFALGAAALGDNLFPKEVGVVHITVVLVCWGAIWLAWTIVFYLYLRNSNALITRVTSWLIKGSVLELLIAVPAHVLVRRRDDCSAPVVTSFGIVTGISIMILSFGPGVLLLYKKRLDEYANRRPTTASPSN